jgi:hypothetical protein
MHDLVDPAVGDSRRLSNLALWDILFSGLANQMIPALNQVLPVGV